MTRFAIAIAAGATLISSALTVYEDNSFSLGPVSGRIASYDGAAERRYLDISGWRLDMGPADECAALERPALIRECMDQ